MPAIVTRHLRLHNAEQFKEAFSETANTAMYMFIAQGTAWDNESSPPTPVDDIESTDFRLWRKILAAKKITDNDITFAIPKYEWVTDTKYRQYKSYDSDLFAIPSAANTFFMITDENKVYKCIYNNKNANSTVKPTDTGTSIINTSDGYRWKFMYNLSGTDLTKFLTSSYMPVRTLTADDGSAQWDVQTAAVDGVIDVIDVTAAGNSYHYFSGNVVSASSDSIIKLHSTASGDDSKYVGYGIFVSSGTGQGQLRICSAYAGGTKNLTVNTAFTTTLDSTSQVIVGPRITITGDGSSAEAYANVDTLSSNGINQIIMSNVGSGYTRAEVVVSASIGTGATARANLSPKGGHGSDAVRELNGTNIMLNAQISGGEANTIIANNDFRTFGLIRDPAYSNGDVLTSSTFDATTKLTINAPINANFQFDELISGETSGANGVIMRFSNSNASNTAGILSLSQVNGTFTTSETINSNTTALSCNISSISTPEFIHTGDILYVENRAAVSRNPSQTENIKIVVQF